MEREFYVFSSNNHKNLQIAYEERLWAIKIPKGENMRKQFRTKSENLKIGSIGLFYDKEFKVFRMPFLVVSKPDSIRIEKNIWEGEFFLPFRFAPLFPPDVKILKNDMNSFMTKGIPWYKHFKFRELTVFIPCEINDDEWNGIISFMDYMFIKICLNKDWGLLL